MKLDTGLQCSLFNTDHCHTNLVQVCRCVRVYLCVLVFKLNKTPLWSSCFFSVFLVHAYGRNAPSCRTASGLQRSVSQDSISPSSFYFSVGETSIHKSHLPFNLKSRASHYYLQMLDGRVTICQNELHWRILQCIIIKDGKCILEKTTQYRESWTVGFNRNVES